MNGKLLVATRSLGKKPEIQEILSDLPYQIVFPEDVGLFEKPEEMTLENEDSFEANARKKAEYFQRLSRLPTVADDSGLEVLALKGQPGVRSRRFAMTGPGEDPDEANNRMLLQKLAGAPPDRRGAQYRCVAVFMKDMSIIPHVFDGRCSGRIVTEPKGTGGFGYDPLFHSVDLDKTFGEATPEEKANVSHRGKAFRQFAEWLKVHPL